MPPDALAAAEARRWAKDGTARRLREHAMLTQAEVAEQVGVTPAAVAAWETGRRVPSALPARKYGELLRSIKEELGEKGTTPQ